MITELEQEFFKVFGVEPKYQDACTVEDKYWQNEELANKYGTFDMYMNAKCGNQENCTTQCSCAYTKEIYPEITDRILIELICLLSELEKFMITNEYKPFSFNKENLKANVLLKLADWIHWYKFKNIEDDIKRQIQQLFKGEE